MLLLLALDRFSLVQKPHMIIKNDSNILALGMSTLSYLLTWENFFKSTFSPFMFQRVRFAYFPRFS